MGSRYQITHVMFGGFGSYEARGGYDDVKVSRYWLT